MFNKKIYIIKKGKAKASGINVKIYKGNSNEVYTFSILSGWYKQDDTPGKTKAFGFTIGLLPKIKKYDEVYSVVTKLPFGYCMIKPQHWNSVRIAIQPNLKEKGVWGVYSYNYVNGIRQVKPMFNTAEKTELDVVLKTTTKNWGWYCYPYYEGDDKTTTDIKLLIDRI